MDKVKLVLMFLCLGILAVVLMPFLLIVWLLIWATTTEPEYDCDKGKHMYSAYGNHLDDWCMICNKRKL